jgi:hypothetical protein
MVAFGEAEHILRARKDSLERANYSMHFHELLWAEELQMKDDILNYSLENAIFKRNGEFLRLDVPGLSENRPSIQIGDYCLVRLMDSRSDILQKGYAHKIEKDTVLFRFSREFHDRFVSGQNYFIQFTVKRSLLRIFHQSIDLCAKLPDFILFPVKVESAPLATNRAPMVNRNLNEEQRKAVDNIYRGEFSAPYVIFGPPGTGLESKNFELKFIFVFQGKHLHWLKQSKLLASVIILQRF